MGNKEILELFNDPDFKRILMGEYRCLKESLKKEFQYIEDKRMLSYLKAYIVHEYESIDNKYAKNNFVAYLRQGCFQEIPNNFIKCINGLIAKMGDLVEPQIVFELRKLCLYKDDEKYKILSKDNKTVIRLIVENHLFLFMNSLKKEAMENPGVKSYFEHIISEDELRVIEYAKEGLFFPNYIAHMLFDEKSYYYHCNHNIYSDDEILKNALLSTYENNPRFDIVFPDGILVEYHMGDIRVKRYTFHQVVEFTKLYLAMNFSEILSQYENPDCPIIYGAKYDNKKLGSDMIKNAYINVQNMLDAYDNVYTQKIINDCKKEFCKLRKTSEKYHL